MTQTSPTDAQLVALAREFGWEVSVQYSARWIRFGGSWFMLPVEPPEAWLLAGAIQQAMAGLGWRMELIVHPSGNAVAMFVREHEDHGWERGEGSSPNSAPDAIVLAACAALGVGE